MTSLFVYIAFLSVPQPIYGHGREVFQASLQCCLQNGVSGRCSENLCQPQTDWEDHFVLEANNLVDQCSSQLTQIGICLSRGRNSSRCCQEKSDSVYQVCQHMCSGDLFDMDVSRNNYANFQNYVSCMLEYFETNLQCIAKSYVEAPSPPVDPLVKQVKLDGARFSWNAPKELANTVTSFTVELQHGDVIQRAVTKNLHYSTGPLNVNTQYSFRVSASSVTGSSQNTAPLLFSTFGVKPTVEAVQNEYNVVLGGDVTLACKISLPGNMDRPMAVVWLKSTSDLQEFTDIQRLYSTGSSNHFSQMHFALAEGRKSVDSVAKLYAAVLTIRNVTSQDLGAYACRVQIDAGPTVTVQAESTLSRARSSLNRLPNLPFDLSECCRERGVSDECMLFCKNNAPQSDRTSKKALECHAELEKIDQCTVPQNVVDNRLCCIREKVPWSCAPLCNGAPVAQLTSPADFHCIQYSSQMLKCDQEGQQNLPMAPWNVRVKGIVSRSIVIITWDLADEMRHQQVQFVVYYRRSDVTDDWQRVMTGRNQATLAPLTKYVGYEAVVLTVNAFGVSDSSATVYFET